MMYRKALRRALPVGLAAGILALGWSSLSKATQVRYLPRPPATAYTYHGRIYDRLFTSLSLRASMRRAATVQRAAPDPSAPAYAITDLGVATSLPIGYGVPLAVNNAGDITFFNQCYCVGPGNSSPALLIHDNGTYTTLYDPSDGTEQFSTIPYAINNSGNEAGSWQYNVPGSSFEAHIDWTRAKTYADPARVDNPSVAFAVNNANVSVGQAPGPGGPFAAVFRITSAGGDKRPELLMPPKSTPWIGTATGINDAGEIVGYALIPSDINTRAVRFFEHSYAKVIPVAAAGVSSSAQAINQHGDIVGNAGSQAFLYRNNRTLYLPRPPGEETGEADAMGINASDEVVGNIFNGTTATAFLYVSGRSYDLNSLLPANSGWQIETVTGINDRGEMIGLGFNSSTLPFASDLYSMKPIPAVTMTRR